VAPWQDVCVFIPAGFSCITVLCVYLLTLEVSRSNNAGLCAAFLMALLPAHLMRSVAGGYDNESVAVAAICSTFFLWVRSQRNDSSWWVGALAGLSYLPPPASYHPDADQEAGLTEIHLRVF
jgi:dolichyl-diphosphooligosaccharide--protein glycosyltransferase